MRKRTIGMLVILVITTSSCELMNNAKDNGEVDIVQGLKTALQVGKDSAVKFTSATDGYYKDELIKIALPPEAAMVYQLKDNPLVGPSITSMEVSMNRAAEYAAPKAKSIFGNAITNMSVGDGVTILNGKNPADSTKAAFTNGFDSLAATHFLKSKTFIQLVDSFSPPMDDALSKDLGLGFSANVAWENLVLAYNAALQLLAITGNTGGLTPIQNTSLGVFATQKALDGLFVKVGDQERLIRRDPYKWASTAVGDILTKVFAKK